MLMPCNARGYTASPRLPGLPCKKLLIVVVVVIVLVVLALGLMGLRITEKHTETLLIGYRSWPGQSCYITRMKKENIQSLDAAVKVFQNIQPRPPASSLKENEEGTDVPLADRSILGTTINILCSSVPIYWA